MLHNIIKLSTPQQTTDLCIGDILKRFPSGGFPEEIFDNTRRSEIDTFEIKSIRLSNKMLGLVMCGDSVGMFPSPGDIGRLFIETYNLIEQNIWWIVKETNQTSPLKK